jgi:phytoene dehydrogenase-like protein
VEKHLLIVGGGLAGLSAGCYGRANGFRTTILEHNLALGGVCTAWRRGPYLVDGCIHWLTGGAFERLYEELGIVPGVRLRHLDVWVTWRDAREGTEIAVTRDLGRLAADLRRLAPSDSAEIERLLGEAERFADMSPGIDRPPEITPLRDQLQAFWDMRGAIGAIAHFRHPMSAWTRDHLRSGPLRRFFQSLFPAEAPTLLLPMVLGYLKRGWLSRPEGGSAAFRDALIDSYRKLGGEWHVNATVDEILVQDGGARGVRLGDGTILTSDAVLSTASTPETVLRLLGGRYEGEVTRRRLSDWKLFEPIVLASFGVAAPLSGVPSMLLVDGLAPFTVGQTENDRLYLRVCNDDRALAPDGHAVVQAVLRTDYDWWATRGTGYEAAKDEAAHAALARINQVIPGIGQRVDMTDVATPLTFWRSARSWRGAYEGWMPSSESIFGHVSKKLRGLEGLYLAGQWLEPGGGVPMAIMSGRQAIQILCADEGRAFRATDSSASGLPSHASTPTSSESTS